MPRSARMRMKPGILEELKSRTDLIHRLQKSRPAKSKKERFRKRSKSHAKLMSELGTHLSPDLAHLAAQYAVKTVANVDGNIGKGEMVGSKKEGKWIISDPTTNEIIGYNLYKRGKLHSTTKPAMVRNYDGDRVEYWFKNGKLHRDNDEPAILEFIDNILFSAQWYLNGQPTRKELLPNIHPPDYIFYEPDGSVLYSGYTVGNDVIFKPDHGEHVIVSVGEIGNFIENVKSDWV